MSSFFLPSKRSTKDRKRKKSVVRKPRPEKEVVKGPKKIKKTARDEEIDSESDHESTKVERKPNGIKIVDDDEEEEETVAEKRLRLAKQYIAQVEEEELSKREDAELDYDAIAHRLKEDVLREAGKLQRKVADTLCAPGIGDVRTLRGHQLPVTCLAVTPDDRFAFSGDKDGCIIKWDLESGVKVHVFKCQKRRKREGKRGGRGRGRERDDTPGHAGCVLGLAVSSDGKFLASGGKGGAVHVWDAETNAHIHKFTGHRDTVSGLAFQGSSHELFSCSLDRTVKIWNLDEMLYVETLFGHQDGVAAIDCLQREKPVTAGTDDRTVRIWKVVQESQLVFTGHKASIDCVRLINEEHFITGSQDGSIALWAVVKKKPLVRRLHNSAVCEEGGGEGREVGSGWVTAVAALPNTDLVASGSSNGHVALWKCGGDFRSLDSSFTVEVQGFVNCLQFAHSGSCLVAAVGQEHRLGRWWRDSSVRNCIAIIPLPRTQNC
ncbi:U3 small nucleolar RNA-interacting protein 2 [Geodia barretti]|uniref:U3 small nucleolar RNA-interacting protein 2 n=1 Tax=Geodia barretti TaxID=519541 RepID=A0AA35SIF3_GEOBA|nr:U3 small nucleolar RNA-interacting protein 2 [Geodia barretti]